MASKLIQHSPQIGKKLMDVYLRDPSVFVSFFDCVDKWRIFVSDHLLFSGFEIDRMREFTPHVFPACRCFYMSSFDFFTDDWVSFHMERCRVLHPGQSEYTSVSIPSFVFRSIIEKGEMTVKEGEEVSTAFLDSPCLIRLEDLYFPSGLHYLYYRVFIS